MAQRCISNESLCTTGFHYTLSLISGKYKMTILYTLMEFGVVRFNEMKRYIGGISYKTLSATLRSWRPTNWSTGRSTPRSLPRWSTASRSGASPSSPSWTTCASGGTTTASDPPVPGRFFEHLFDFLPGVWYNTPD